MDVGSYGVRVYNSNDIGARDKECGRESYVSCHPPSRKSIQFALPDMAAELLTKLDESGFKAPGAACMMNAAVKLDACAMQMERDRNHSRAAANPTRYLLPDT